MHPKRMHENGKSILKTAFLMTTFCHFFFEILRVQLIILILGMCPFFQKLAMVAAKKTEITYTMSPYVFLWFMLLVEAMLTAFTSCCDRTPRFISSGRKKGKSATDDATVELVFPTISSFKAHHQNVNCLKLFKILQQNQESNEDIDEDQTNASGDRNGNARISTTNRETILASCSENIKLFDVNENSGTVNPATTLSNGHEKDVKCLTGMSFRFFCLFGFWLCNERSPKISSFMLIIFEIL